MERTLTKMMAPLARKIRAMAGRAVIRLVDDALKEQGVQVDVLSGETRECERYQHYGFTSVPLTGAEGIVLFVGGSRDHGVVVADGDRRYRLKGLAGGEVAIYDDQGQAVHLTRSGIEIYGTVKVTIDAPDVEITGDLVIGGDVSAGGNVSDSAGSIQAMRGVYNGHVHGSSPGPSVSM